MPTHRAFPHAVLLTAATLLLAVGVPVAAAAPDAPSWITPTTVSGAEGFTPGGASAVMADGTIVTVYKHGDDPTQSLYATVRDPDSGTWSGPEQISDGPYVNELRIVPSSDGIATVVWTNRDGTSFVKARSYVSGTGWGTLETLQTDTAGLAVDVQKDGSVTVATDTIESPNHVIRIFTRPAGSATFSGDTVDLGATTDYQRVASVAYNKDGNGVLLWMRDVGGGSTQLRAATYTEDAHSWVAAADAVVEESTSIGGACLAIDNTGRAAVLYGRGQVNGGAAASGSFATMAANGTWTATQDPITTPNTGTLATDSSCLAADQHGHFVAVWQEYNLDPDDGHALYETSTAKTRTLTAATGAWSDLGTLGTGLGGAPSIAADGEGNIMAVKLGTTDNEHLQYISFYRPAAGNALGNQALVTEDNGAAWCGVPSVQADVNGNFSVTYGEGPQDYSACRVGVNVADGSAPTLDGFSLDSSGLVNDSLSFSVSPLDAWSALGATSWDFGDGGTSTGTSVTHQYAQAGTYTVTVTSADALGYSTSKSSTVTISDPPPPPSPPAVIEKTKLPPVIPARLTGKKITITTTVPNCTSRFVATTKFGTTKYQTKLKLTKSGKVCTATGTITLKKAPSTRTKLRVAIGRVTKTGTKTITTLTTKRG